MWTRKWQMEKDAKKIVKTGKGFLLNPENNNNIVAHQKSTGLR